MPVHDDLGKRMKEYEKAGQKYLTRRMPVILRLDISFTDLTNFAKIIVLSLFA